jgi:hypothetical protein
MKVVTLALAAAVLASPAAAQEWQVARETFAFAGSQLEIEVDAYAPGTLRVIRGNPGSVHVAGRAVSGFTGAGLGDERLTLTAAGDGPVDYLVSVPVDVWVEVRIPGAVRGESMAGRVRSRTFQWEAAAPPPEPVAEWRPPLDERDARYTAYTRPQAPAVIALPDLGRVRSVDIRIEGDRFRVVTSRPLAVAEGDPDLLEIRPADPPMDVIVTLPAVTATFRLDMGGQTALVIDGDDVRALCAPVTRQWLSDGRRWLTFTPVGGALQCGSRPVPRHEG